MRIDGPPHARAGARVWSVGDRAVDMIVNEPGRASAGVRATALRGDG
jgi:hypothetical protein